jgi:uncharacterized protein YggU (UPF0235/DUF167 family)
MIPIHETAMGVTFAVKVSSVTIASGETPRRKVIGVAAVSADAVRKRLDG